MKCSSESLKFLQVWKDKSTTSDVVHPAKLHLTEAAQLI
jgi:hypothetical protein